MLDFGGPEGRAGVSKHHALPVKSRKTLSCCSYLQSCLRSRTESDPTEHSDVLRLLIVHIPSDTSAPGPRTPELGLFYSWLSWTRAQWFQEGYFFKVPPAVAGIWFQQETYVFQILCMSKAPKDTLTISQEQKAIVQFQARLLGKSSDKHHKYSSTLCSPKNVS